MSKPENQDKVASASSTAMVRVDWPVDGMLGELVDIYGSKTAAVAAGVRVLVWVGEDYAGRLLALDSTGPLPIGAEAITEALTAWAQAIDRATEHLDLDIDEWNLIADVMNGTLATPGYSRPAMLVAANVEDGHRLSGVGLKWFGDDANERTNKLVNKLMALDYVGGWAVLYAARWFWAHADTVETDKPWWTPLYRRRHPYAPGGNVAPGGRKRRRIERDDE